MTNAHRMSKQDRGVGRPGDYAALDREGGP